MGGATGLAPEQLAALDRIARLPEAQGLHLAGGSAVAYHFSHRLSEDLDLFSTTPDLDLSALRGALASSFPTMAVRGESDVTLKVLAGGATINFVRYPYAPLEPPRSGPAGIPVASVRDLAAMKLAAVARRGIRRDFWDLYTIGLSGRSLSEMARDYRQKFGREESDLYHVLRALTYFADADSDPIFPRGMTKDLWAEIQVHFEREAPTLLG